MRHVAVKIVIGMAVLLAVAIIASAFAMGGEQYEMSKAREWMFRARASNDLTDMAKYLNQSYDIMSKHHGNPVWVLPTPDTDIDLITQNIAECMANCEKTNMSDMAYQQAVHNLQETIIEIAEHIDIVATWVFWTPPMVAMWTTLCWAWIPLALFGVWLED